MLYLLSSAVICFNEAAWLQHSNRSTPREGDKLNASRSKYDFPFTSAGVHVGYYNFGLLSYVERSAQPGTQVHPCLPTHGRGKKTITHNP
ncbi:hypothetical protein EDC01DRAFT_216705 [Geopyxis carbonaria]|nr:hypothetical protein EDC01DRAFT_216705 [Geopyxis carbonaria]